jgi:hypothetical protein
MLQPPHWISPESWQAFHEVRKRIKAPLTAYAEKLIIGELVRLKSSGEDPQACLDQSIRLGWRDVFPVRDKQLKQRPGSDIAATRRMLDDYDAVQSDPAARRKALQEAKAAIRRQT